MVITQICCFRCPDCQRTFQLDYAYEASKPGVKNKIFDMAMNSSGARDTGRVLKVAYNTVSSSTAITLTAAEIGLMNEFMYFSLHVLS